MAHFINRLAPRQPFQSMLAQRFENHCGRYAVATKIMGHFRHEGLSTVAERRHASGPIHRLAIVVAITELGLSRMTPHADANPHGSRP